MSRHPVVTVFRKRSTSRARAATLLAVVFALVAFSGRLDAQATGRITGTVVDAATGAPLVNCYANVYNPSGLFVDSAATNASGVYTVFGLAAGTYYVRSSNAPGYIGEVYDNVPCPDGSCDVTTGTAVGVTAGITTGGINFGLTLGGTVTGTVTNAVTGTPLADVHVYVITADGTYLGSDWTNASGSYTIIGVAAGTHYLRTENSLGYLDELYNDLPCSEYFCYPYTAGTAVGVTAGATTSGINFGLTLGGTIAGTVTDAGTGAPLADVGVGVYDGSGNYVENATTDASGMYAITSLPTGTYQVLTSNELGYVDELYQDKRCPLYSCYPYTTGTGVSVTAGSTSAGVNFGLVMGGTITGTVTDAATRAPIAGAGVFTRPSGDLFSIVTATDTSGRYMLRGIPAGSYYLLTWGWPRSTPYVDEQYPDVECVDFNCSATAGSSIVVLAEQTTSGIDFQLSVGGQISGAVTAAAGNVPLGSVRLQIYGGSGQDVARVWADGAGVFTSPGLPAGSYYLRTVEAPGYLNELYNNLPCWFGCTPATGTKIPVAVGHTATGINFALDAGGAITGTVTNAGTGAPLNQIEVDVYNAAGTYLSHAKSTVSGVYTLTGLGTGTYYVRTSNSDGYIDELYNDLPCAGGSCTATSGTGVSVTAGLTTSGINFGLAVPPVPPVITWANPGAIVYGTALSATQLNATANVAGTFVYTPASGTVLNAGAAQTLSVTFTPADAINHTTATKTVTITVTKATPVVTWANPAAIAAGTALGATQLNATADVAGTFAYTPSAGTVLGVGVGQTLSVTFTPTDAVNYPSVTRTVVIDVLAPAGAPVITDVTPGSGPIGTGVTLTGTGFTGTTAVTFNGVPAAYAVVSDTLATTTVPAGTTTGPVRVTTPVWTATSAADFVVTNQRATRSLPGCYVAGYGVTVSIDVGPAPEVLQQAVADTPPAGWTVGTISDGGVWDAPASQVTWGPFFDATARVLTYMATPPAETTGTVTFAGVTRFDGVEVPLGGTPTLSRCEQHPADANRDLRLVIGEVTGYGAAWKKGSTWSVPPVPIPIGYVTRAGYLWRAGEWYRRDAGACPVCWMPLTALPLPVPDAFLSLEDIPAPRSGPWSPEASENVRSPGASAFANRFGGPPKPWWRRSAPGAPAPILSVHRRRIGTAVRQVPATYVPTVPLIVTLTVTPDSDVQTWAVEETVPAGWQVSSVSADGYWDEKAGVVRWGPFFDETPQTLRYTLTPAAGASGPQDMRGTASFDGVDVAVTGAHTLRRAPITRPGDPGR